MKNKNYPVRKILIFCLCVGFAFWKSQTWIELHQNALAYFAHSHVPSPEKADEVVEFVHAHSLTSIFLSPALQDKNLDYFRIVYKIWPSKTEATAEYGVVQKSEACPRDYETFLTGTEVNFVKRIH